MKLGSIASIQMYMMNARPIWWPGKISDINLQIFQLKPHCIRCSHFKVELYDVRALEPSSKLPVRIVEDYNNNNNNICIACTGLPLRPG
jgi:hypothetical protein